MVHRWLIDVITSRCDHHHDVEGQSVKHFSQTARKPDELMKHE